MRFAPLAAAAVIMLTAPFAAQAAEVTPLVTADWVKANAGDENIVIVDIRDKIADTDLGDLPYIADAVVAPYASAGWRTRRRVSRTASAATFRSSGVAR
jgi:thiosulfate/3-mercaptopyruvate sulfurtransferase